jgi:glycosyltransferase involved in cell wall biosynthesis
MRIAVFSHYFLPEIGAPSARIGDFAARWIERGHEVHVATGFPNHPTGLLYPGYRLRRYQYERLDRIHVHRNWTYITPNQGFLRRTLGHFSLWPSVRLNTLPRLPRAACAIGTSPTFFAAMAARDCARRQGIPFIMDVRDLWPAVFRDLGIVKNAAIFRLLERWEMNLYRSAAQVVTATESFRDDIVGRGIPAERVATITNGADADYWQPAPCHPDEVRSSLELRDKFVVLYAGAHGVSQALGTLLRAAARLRLDSRIAFVVVGEGAEKAGLQREARAQGLSNVRFLDGAGRDRIREYYAVADLCFVPLRAIPSFGAFIPSKIFEIMAMGRPILASLRGEAAALLARSGAARVVAPEDDEAVARAVAELSLDPDALARMGAAGPEFVTANYSRRQLADRYLDVIERLGAAAKAAVDPRKTTGPT